MPDVVISQPAIVSAPADYTIAGAQDFELLSVQATIDGSGAAAAFLPTLELLDPGGHVMATATASSVAAGGSAAISWFPGVGLTKVAPGTLLDYVEQTSVVTVATGGHGTQTTVLAGNAIVYDGATKVRVEMFCPSYDFQAGNILADLYLDSTELARWAQADIDPSPVDAGWPVLLVRYITPSAGSHTFTVKCWTGGASPALFGGGTGTGGDTKFMPAYLAVIAT